MRIKITAVTTAIALLITGCAAATGSSEPVVVGGLGSESAQESINPPEPNKYYLRESDFAYSEWYRECAKEYPQYIFSEEAWFAKGFIDFPFALHDYSYREDKENFPTDELKIMHGNLRYFIPQGALKKASTAELLRLVPQVQGYHYILYNFQGGYLLNLSRSFNAIEEMVAREDFPEVLLDVYIKEELKPRLIFEDSKQQEEHDESLFIQENDIVLKEVLLASNNVFDRMDDEMRQRTIEAVMEKIDIRQREEFSHYRSISGFFAYVSELQYFWHGYWDEELQEHVTPPPPGSKWYAYIKDTLKDDELTGYIDSFWRYRYNP
ncbi:MAG: hypothetical protein FWG31_00195 [Oscillospiraceae bacterium]|nr:hypothetical protein [Oscillospiraceae bacterium]